VENDLRYELDIAFARFRVRVALVVGATLVMDGICTLAAYLTERGATDEFKTIWQALFFCTTQLLTVSSSLPNPENAGTKVIDVLMEVWGVLVVAGAAGIVGDLLHHRTRHRVMSSAAASRPPDSS
jgi:uncharacterized membrane protein HdeD (DUF308 family)